MVLGKLPVPWRPTIRMIVGQGPIALAVSAGGVCLDIFSLHYPFSYLLPLWGWSVGAKVWGKPPVPGRPTTLDYSRSRVWFGWFGCFGFNGPLRQYFSLYRAVSQREGERRERIDESKNVQTTPTRTYCKRNRPLPYCNQNCRTPRHWKLTQHHRTTRPPPVGQGPIALAVGAGGGCLDIFFLIYHFSFLSPSLWETALYRLKYCLKGP